jgi:hypothetical protein
MASTTIATSTTAPSMYLFLESQDSDGTLPALNNRGAGILWLDMLDGCCAIGWPDFPVDGGPEPVALPGAEIEAGALRSGAPVSAA